jgi:hypothetical protein
MPQPVAKPIPISICNRNRNRTVMPDGLEAAISKEQMSDLLAFLLGK